jgi:hypothetical protein
MKKAILVLVIIIGLFTSCEQDEDIFDDCNCVKTVYQKYVTQLPEPTYILTNENNVECQDESRVVTSSTIIEVKCNPNY